MSQAYRFASLLLIVCAVAAPAYAQEGGVRLSGFYAGAFGEGATNAAAGGTVGYRFTPRFGFEVEALALPDLEIEGVSRSGRGLMFLTNFVAEFPSPARWLTPYVQGGGGVANIRQSADFVYVDLDGRRSPTPVRDRVGPGRNAQVPRFTGDAVLERIVSGRAETSLALAVGGGIDFSVWRGLAFGPTITFTKLFGGFDDVDLTRIGARAAYRF